MTKYREVMLRHLQQTLALLVNRILDTYRMHILYECGDAANHLIKRYVKGISFKNHPLSIFDAYCVGAIASRTEQLESMNFRSCQIKHSHIEIMCSSISNKQVRIRFFVKFLFNLLMPIR